MNYSQIKKMGKLLMAVLPLLVLLGYLLAIIYQQWWLRQFNLPVDFVILNANTLVTAAIILGIMLFILMMCYYSLLPLFNKENIFRRKSDLSNLTHARIIALSLMVYSIYGIVSFFKFEGSIDLFSLAVIGAVASIMIWLTTFIVDWGMKARSNKKKWYARPYLYFERRPMTPIIVALVIFLLGSYLIAGQLAIKNWQAYIKDPTIVQVDGKDEYVLIGVFGDKAGVVMKNTEGVETDTTKFVDIDRMTIKYRFPE